MNPREVEEGRSEEPLKEASCLRTVKLVKKFRRIFGADSGGGLQMKESMTLVPGYQGGTEIEQTD